MLCLVRPLWLGNVSNQWAAAWDFGFEFEVLLHVVSAVLSCSRRCAGAWLAGPYQGFAFGRSGSPYIRRDGVHPVGLSVCGGCRVECVGLSGTIWRAPFVDTAYIKMSIGPECGDIGDSLKFLG